MNTESQNKRILKWLQSGKQLTAIDALQLFGCFRLAARINDLKRQGVPIGRRMINVGDGTRYASYWLKKYIITNIGGNCPVQAEGRTFDGKYFYFRARHETIYFQVSENERDWQLNNIIFHAARSGYEPHAAGWITEQEARNLIHNWMIHYEQEFRKY